MTEQTIDAPRPAGLQSARGEDAPLAEGASSPLAVVGMQAANARAEEPGRRLAAGLDQALPARLHLGKGNVLSLQGWCYAPGGALRTLEVLVGEAAYPIAHHSWARPDIFTRDCPAEDATGASLMSGFEGLAPLPAIGTPQSVTLRLRATLETGESAQAILGSILLLPGHAARPIVAAWPGTGPRIAICMATYHPPADLFEAQIASLLAQTHGNWICIISDDGTPNEAFDRIRYRLEADGRFHLFQNPERQNFYRNFETCLGYVPDDAEYVALCDQDDVWHPEKLAKLLGAFDAETTLAYSDARIVDAGGAVRSATFWVGRRNNYTDLATLMVANTITGAAAMMRRDLLADILPFPEPVGPMFHDHWIGLMALYRGRIAYVDQPLYDYVQHAEGVIGHNYNAWPGFLALAREVLRHLPNRGRMARAATGLLKQAVADYVFVQQKAMLGRMLLLRLPEAAPGKRAVAGRFAAFTTAPGAVLREKIAASLTRRPTLNLEGMFLWCLLGTRLRNMAFRAKSAEIVRLQKERPGARLLEAVIAGEAAAPAAPQALAEMPTPEPAAEAPRLGVLEYGNTRPIFHNISGLTLDVSNAHPKRANLLLAMIDFKYVFGGYLGMFNLALRLSREGYRTRIILHEHSAWDMAEWRQQIRKYPGITTLFDEVEVISRFDRTIPVPVNPQDRFIATNCWAAHIAHETVAALEEKRFLFMIQEYEPYFLPMNSISALFQQAYDFPQVALFSTDLLAEFFRQQKIGVFARPGGEAQAAVFSNAIQRFHPKREVLERAERRVLIYARPEEHAARNLFELSMIALSKVARDPRLSLDRWSFHGIGSIDRQVNLELAPGVPLQLVPKTSLQDYIDMMPRFDVGLSLMLTPHPSLVPLEMAAAGLWAVTNTFANKTAEALAAISSNLIGVPPTIDGIAEGMVQAMLQVDDIDRRLAGAAVAWPTDWDAAFTPETMAAMRTFLGPVVADA